VTSSGEQSYIAIAHHGPTAPTKPKQRTVLKAVPCNMNRLSGHCTGEPVDGQRRAVRGDFIAQRLP